MPSWNFSKRKKKRMSLFSNVWLTEKLDFLIKKNNLKTGIISEEQVKIKLFQLFKSIAKYLDLSLTYPWTLRKLFHLLLPLYLYQWQLLMESWDRVKKKQRLFEIISLENQKHYIQFHRNMLHGFLTIWL